MEQMEEALLWNVRDSLSSGLQVFRDCFLDAKL